MTPLLVALGAAVGAPTRYLVDRWVQRRNGTSFPWGTLTVNMVGCLVLGALAGAMSHQAVSGQLYALLGTGFCGALTTYSTFGFETVSLIRGRAGLHAVGNAVVSLAAGLGCALVGVTVAGGLVG